MVCEQGTLKEILFPSFIVLSGPEVTRKAFSDFHPHPLYSQALPQEVTEALNLSKAFILEMTV